MHPTKSMIRSIVGAILAVVLFTASGASLPALSFAHEGSPRADASERQDLSCSLQPPTILPTCGSTGNTVTATVSGGTIPYTLSWALTGDGMITAGQGTDAVTFDVGASGGGVTLVLTVTDATEAQSQCSLQIFCPTPLPPDFCTLAQGWYGNDRSSFNATHPLALVQSLLSGEDLVIGGPGRSVRITLSAGGCIVQGLPAGGMPRQLPSALNDATLDSISCQTAPTLLPVNSSGKFSNVLLGQTIALSLNIRLSAGLGSLGICNLMTTQAMLPGPDGLLGTIDDVLNPGRDGELGTSDDPIATFNIASSVTTALSVLGLPQNVSGLLDLANRALGGKPTGGASIGDINTAVSAVNRAFDGCRALLSCSNL